MIFIDKQTNTIKISNKQDDKDEEFSLTGSEKYLEFLIWITNPDTKVDIPIEAFEPDPDADEADQPLLQRYNQLLCDFINQRNEFLKKPQANISDEEVKKQINKLIESLEANSQKAWIEGNDYQQLSLLAEPTNVPCGQSKDYPMQSL